MGSASDLSRQAGVAEGSLALEAKGRTGTMLDESWKIRGLDVSW
jgi:hypothetical protein